MTKGPNILRVQEGAIWETLRYESRGERPYSVYITLKQLRKLPPWAQEHLDWVYCAHNNRHCYVNIGAKDELQAAMRFNKLWAGLPKE